MPVPPPMRPFDRLPAGWAVLDGQGRIVDHNRVLSDLLGAAEGSLMEAHFGDILTGASRALYQGYLYPLLKLSGQIDELEIGLRAGDGHSIDALLSARFDADENQVQLLLLPLRRRRELQDQLLVATRVAEHVPGLLFQLVRRPDGRWVMPYASDALRELYGLERQSVADDLEPWFAAMHPEDAYTVRHTLALATSTVSQRLRFEHRVVQAGRTRWLAAEADARAVADGSLVLHGYVSDVTEQRATADALVAKEAAQRASQQKTEFLARVSHELRTPLNSILGFTQLLLIERAKVLSQGEREKLLHIERAGQDLLTLIGEVLDVSRIESGELALVRVPVRVEPLFRHVCQLVRPLAERRRVRLELQVDPRLALIADAQRLQQVLLNLVSNAVKYNCEGGAVRIGARSCPGARDVRIAIADDGPGFSAEQRLHMYQPFNRLGAERSSTEGSGLGLVIARGLVEQMGGALVLESPPGTGAEFVFSLPVALASEAPDDDLDGQFTTSELVRAARPKHVLYVEDNPLNVALMEAVFSMRPGYVLRTVASAQEAEAALEGDLPDLLLLDMHLPDALGDELLVSLRARHGECLPRVIAVSADAVPDDIARARARGFDDYWTKPINVKRTLEALDELLGEPAPVHSAAR
jgi:signal transduction histidine kinase/ActR/RegA family two-component response regulator